MQETKSGCFISEHSVDTKLQHYCTVLCVLETATVKAAKFMK